jgi:hypothetical protein
VLGVVESLRQGTSQSGMKAQINGIPTELLATCFELFCSGGTVPGIAERFNLNKDRLSKAIRLAKRDGLS